MLNEAFSNETVDIEQIKNLSVKYGDISTESLPDDYYYDYGSDEPFSLAGRGPGECGAGMMDVIKLDIDEAKDALKKAPVDSDNVYKAIVGSARALLVTVGLEPKKDREILAAFAEYLIAPGWVKSQTQQLLDDAMDWRMGDRESLDDLLPQIRELTARVEELFLSLDANLKFKVEPIESKITAEQVEDKTHKADLRGVACPLNFVKAKLELEKIDIGDVLEVLLDEGESVRNVPASFVGQGQEVMEVKDLGGHFCVKVRRQK
jgi:sulfite reductase (ferredoxin)